ncbi:alpha-amylase family glycosyl hydrolase [Flavobacterium frigidarium]|uniref:alpha-amylase family glycosyl hydrolase n=1 Tax=Flavobacterium frigidarium TaxID=99286 RepID=UPI0030DC5D22|tara:strand:- start:7394 stop:9259 length:1866 start_codon:yes stop_codon:yes gene_type:complete
MRNKIAITAVTFAIIVSSCKTSEVTSETKIQNKEPEKKVVVYQVFTRLFGNKNTTNKPWGTIAENGVGKFEDFTDVALREIKDLGVDYIWYTGVPHHAVITDYTKYGISNDDPDVVKGRAGSPYAVKDYYNVDPDLAVQPENRLQEFEALIARTHNLGMKVIIDIVPNHIARKYEGKNNPDGVEDFGASDDTSVAYKRDNNFYYIPDSKFEVPDTVIPLNGEKHALSDGKFTEIPAKWTGNGSKLSKPDKNDWYETVKINYGVRPDGTKDFPLLPANYATKPIAAHYAFWKNKDVPNSWKKFRDIALYWTAKGVDGFRYDMAEMVPYEFWSYMNSAIKMANPDAFLVAEVYQPDQYRNYIQLGKMDYLYDKVATYDKLKAITQGKANTNDLTIIQNELADIEHHMLHFLDNHDEQRLANKAFAGSAESGKALMVVSTTISSAPTMIYFGQEVGEAANENSGYGTATRTSIFDYVGVPNHQKWMNNGKFDGGGLSPKEKELRNFYRRLLNFSRTSDALMGKYAALEIDAKTNEEQVAKTIYAFARWSANEKLIVISNFSATQKGSFDVVIPSVVASQWNLTDGTYTLIDQLSDGTQGELNVREGKATISITIAPLESFIYKL